MSGVDEIEQAVRDLGPEDLQEFREWFARFDAEVWDKRLEEDSSAGRLDDLVEQAVAEHAAGRTRPL